MSEDFTIVTLRFERYELFSRYLEYSESHGIKTVVVDGSQEAYRHSLPSHIDYYHMPNLDFMLRLRFAMAKVTTSYVVIQADDDFLYPEALKKAAKFLAKNPDYSAVTGQVFVFDELFSLSAIKFSKYIVEEKAFPLEYDSASDRIEAHLSNYMFTFYSMQRTLVWRGFCDVVDRSLLAYDAYIIPRPSVLELCQSIHCAASGKIMFLQQPWLLREYFPNSAGSGGQQKNTDLALNSAPTFQDFLKALDNVLIKVVSGISGSVHQSLVQGFEQFMCKSVGKPVWEQIGDAKDAINLHGKNVKTFNSILEIIYKYKVLINQYYYSSGGKHLAYWYDSNWVFTIVEKFLKISLHLENYIIYGAGEHTEKLLDAAGEMGNLVAVVDSNERLWGTEIKGVRCISPEKILDYSKNVVISSQQHEKEILAYLKRRYSNKIELFPLYTGYR